MMNLPAIESEITKKILGLSMEQQADILQYLNKITQNVGSKESYRKRAIKEIRTALRSI
ncbi:hypothetical protein [Reichenbachiella ulvae]|uniref:Uncharacterized protein n=1 Tax=Reichenbachiella ulvae TaxID=2980104 RepID=A0ABT3CV59_9BACT|nr:hypothetical protein [Reichenbachiella ulvae]MCV9387582.1 hypothetical protein [Reichenbachiella ulvae]